MGNRLYSTREDSHPESVTGNVRVAPERTATTTPVDFTDQAFNLELFFHRLEQIHRSFVKNASQLQIDSPSPKILKHFRHCIDGLRNVYQQMNHFQRQIEREFAVAGLGAVSIAEQIQNLFKNLCLVEESYQLNQWENFVDRVEFRLVPYLRQLVDTVHQALRQSNSFSET